jgi:uncharacterized flavoprotein (TIGR03862 family)
MKHSLVIVGGGPAALMVAACIDSSKYDVSIYEKNNAPGRKFLVAGDGGFNLTHSENIDLFVNRYTPPAFLEKCIRKFSNENLRNWLKNIGIETYVGTSKRVFPVKGIKPIDVLNAILSEIKKKNIPIHTSHSFKGWDEGLLLFANAGSTIKVKADLAVIALGGASWKVTGSDGAWLSLFTEKGIRVLPFQASNCAYKIDWHADFIQKAAGQALKNIVLKAEEKEKAGEVVITTFGMEGGALYALSPAIRKQIDEKQKAIVYIDLKPGITAQQIKDKFMNRGNRSVKKLLEDRLSFTDLQVGLLKSLLSKEEFTDLELLAEKIKKLPITIAGMAPIDEAISTVGGIALREVDENFELKKIPGTYVIGEMLNWDAPTGGYLLQACFSMGKAVADELNSKAE